MERPVFVMIAHTNTAMGGLVKHFTKGYYNHAAITFSPDLSKLYSFSRYYVNTPNVGGFVVEKPARYLSEEEPTPIKLYILPADDEDYAKIRKKIDGFVKNRKKYIYNSFGAVSSSMGKKKKIKDAYTDAEFVAHILEIKNVHTVEDLEKVLEHYRIYTGTIQKYLHGEYECDEVYYERQSFARVFYGTVSHFTKLAKRALFNK